MTPALWGILAALGWGSADYIARFTGRSIGHHAALFGMLLTSTVIFTAIIVVSGAPLIWRTDGLVALGVAGVGVMVGTLLLYWGLARGPVTVVAPIVASYPVINVLYALWTGQFPTLLQWAAMACVMAGVIVVAKCVGHFKEGDEYQAHDLRKTILIALASALTIGVSVISLQAAGRMYGEMQAVFMTRWISLAAIFAVLAWRRDRTGVPGRLWPLITLQGALDGAAYLGIALGGQATGGEITAVVASTFSVVTIILARLFLKETMSLPQGLGIGLIVAGVVVLLMP